MGVFGVLVGVCVLLVEMGAWGGTGEGGPKTSSYDMHASSSSYDMHPPPHMTCMHPPPQEREDQRLPHMTCMHPPPQEREDQRLQTVAIYHELLRSCQARGLVEEATSYLEMVTPCSAEYELN